jgi:hypothetical protein
MLVQQNTCTQVRVPLVLTNCSNNNNTNNNNNTDNNNNNNNKQANAGTTEYLYSSKSPTGTH